MSCLYYLSYYLLSVSALPAAATVSSRAAADGWQRPIRTGNLFGRDFAIAYRAELSSFKYLMFSFHRGQLIPVPAISASLLSRLADIIASSLAPVSPNDCRLLTVGCNPQNQTFRSNSFAIYLILWRQTIIAWFNRKTLPFSPQILRFLIGRSGHNVCACSCDTRRTLYYAQFWNCQSHTSAFQQGSHVHIQHRHWTPDKRWTLFFIRSSTIAVTLSLW